MTTLQFNGSIITLDNVRVAIAQGLGDNRVDKLSHTESLVSTGIISSLEIVVVALAIERYFNIKIPDTAVTINNFNTLEAILALIKNQKEQNTLTKNVEKNEITNPYLRSLTSAIRRPITLLISTLVFLVLLDFGLAALMAGPLKTSYQRFHEFGERLYPVSGGYTQDDLAFAVSKHKIIQKTLNINKGVIRKDDLRIAVFGDSGTIGSWVKAEESIPGFIEHSLQKKIPKVTVFNLAYFMQFFAKDLMILESAIEQSQQKLPFDVAVFTLGDDYFFSPFINNLMSAMPYLAENAHLLDRFMQRLPNTDRTSFESFAQDLKVASSKNRSKVESWLRLNSALHHYAPFFRYFFDNRPYIVPLNANYNFEGQFRIGRISLFSPPTKEPPTNFTTGLKQANMDSRIISMLQATVSFLNKQGIAVVLYVKPHGPKEWSSFYQKNVGPFTALDIANKICKEANCKVVDLQWSLPGAQFTDSIAHYKMEANKMIGAEIAKVIIKEYSK